MIAGVISLFFAGWFSVAISGTLNWFIALIVALTVWGLAYLIVMTLEAIMVSSVLGLLYHASTSALHGIGTGFKASFGKSEADTADTVEIFITLYRYNMNTALPNQLFLRKPYAGKGPKTFSNCGFFKNLINAAPLLFDGTGKAGSLIFPYRRFFESRMGDIVNGTYLF